MPHIHRTDNASVTVCSLPCSAQRLDAQVQSAKLNQLNQLNHLEAEMSHVIEIDDEVFAFLQQLVRRLAGLDAAGQEVPFTEAIDTAAPSTRPRIVEVVLPDTGRAAPGLILREAAYELPVLDYLEQQPLGRAPSRIVINAVGEYLESRGLLTDMDKKRLNSGDIRWRARAAFARKHLKERGDLDGNAPRGIWQITDQGRRRVQEWREAGRPL
jgi:hypothetical protein